MSKGRISKFIIFLPFGLTCLLLSNANINVLSGPPPEAAGTYEFTSVRVSVRVFVRGSRLDLRIHASKFFCTQSCISMY